MDLEAIRARCSEPVTEIVASPREYFRVQQILRDRADLLAAVDRLRKLYYLAAHDVIFFSTYDAKTDSWPDVGQYYCPVVSLPDTFGFAIADGEPLADEQIDLLIRLWKEFDYDGVIAWAAHLRKREPITPLQTDRYRAAKAAVSAPTESK